MWNKPQDEQESNESPPEAKPPVVAPPPAASTSKAVLGPSISIEGTLSGDEDFLIEGRVKGQISFKKHSVTIGERGRIKADMYCKRIYVDGEVHGNLYGDEMVVIRKSGRVHGNASAPRVNIEDGAQFHGQIDMSPNEQSASGSERGSKARQAETPKPPVPTPNENPKQQTLAEDSVA